MAVAVWTPRLFLLPTPTFISAQTTTKRPRNKILKSKGKVLDWDWTHTCLRTTTTTKRPQAMNDEEKAKNERDWRMVVDWIGRLYPNNADEGRFVSGAEACGFRPRLGVRTGWR
ncbi:hypothetical protein K438DRAFT_1958513 [Mycena galopus ATCC 62051]|nr:hypothetical protein K438DRAFT_1958513 [Mycena galopus ATCC 62051]